MYTSKNSLTQSMNYNSGQLSGAVSPQKGYKTRTVYKNAPVHEDPNDRRSLYGVSYNKSPKANLEKNNYGVSPSNSKPGNLSQSQKLTLADLGAGKRRSFDKGAMNKTGKSVGFEVPKSRESNRSGQSGQNGQGYGYSNGQSNGTINGTSNGTLNGANNGSVNGVSNGHLSDRRYEKKASSDAVQLEGKMKGTFLEMQRHKIKGNETVTDIIRHPQDRAKSVATRKDFYDCGCPIHDGRAVVAADEFKSTMRSDLGHNPVVMAGEGEYFDAVRKLDICGNCWKQQKQYYPDPKMIYKGPGQSLYKRDFVKHPLDDKGPVLKNDFYNTFQSSFPLDATTTMRNDYKPWQTGPVKKETMNFKPATSGIPFGGNTNYRIDYPNWGPNMIVPEKAPHQKTTIAELPFNGLTTYKDEFGKPDETNQLKPAPRDNKKSPITSGIPFLGNTTHKDAFKPFKVSQVPNFEPAADYEPTEALPDHLKSLYKKDFGAPKAWICPAVVFMQHHPHPRYDQFAKGI